MKILLATRVIKDNPIIRQLVDALSAHPDVAAVASGVEPFWGAPLDADIVHFHWFESLFGWKAPSEADFERLRGQVEAWRQRAALVVTVHDRYPHYRDSAAFRRLFETMYGAMDGFVHMGQTSQRELNAAYPALAAQPAAQIPIGSVESYFPNTISQADARRELRIPANAYAYLAFGKLRAYEETRFLLDGFRALRMRDKQLIIAGPQVSLKTHRLELLNIFERQRLKRHPRLHVRRRFVPDADVQTYLNAANVLLIPRLQILNSSNISLGFSFGKVVVGPDDGNVGEILRETGNPTFVPGDPASFARAMAQARELDAAGKGAENLAYARAHWNWERIAEAHVAFYRRVLAGVQARRAAADARE